MLVKHFCILACFYELTTLQVVCEGRDKETNFIILLWKLWRNSSNRHYASEIRGISRSFVMWKRANDATMQLYVVETQEARAVTLDGIRLVVRGFTRPTVRLPRKAKWKCIELFITYSGNPIYICHPSRSQLQILSLSIMLHCLMSVCRIIIKIMDYGRTSLLRHLNTRIYSSLVQYSTGTLWVMTLPRVHPWTCSRTFYRDLLSAYLPIEFADYQAETQATQTIQAMQKFLASRVGYGQEYELVPISTMNLCTNEPSDKWTLGRIGLDSMVLYMYCLDSNAHPVSNPSVFWALACSMFIVFAAQCYESAAYAVMRCLSVTFVSCVKTNKDIFRMFSPSGSHTILVFRIKCHGSIPTGTP